MHDGRCTNNLLANRTSFRSSPSSEAIPLAGLVRDHLSSHESCLTQYHPLNRAFLKSFTCIHLAIPRCSFHLAHKLRVVSLLFRNSMNCPHWFCSLWRLDNEFSRTWYDPRNQSILMQLLQLAPEIVVVVHHPHSLFSELHHLVAVTLVLDHLIRYLLS